MSNWLHIIEGGVLYDRSLYLSEVNPPSFTAQRGSRGTATVSLHVTSADTYKPILGTQLYLYEETAAGYQRVFAGSIDTITLTWNNDLGERDYALSCVAFEQAFDTLLITPRTYAAGTPCGTVFSDILATTCAGVPPSSGTISAGANLAGPLIINYDRPSAIFDQLAQDSGFIWYIDPAALTVNFKAASTPSAPFTLAASDILWGTIEWDQTRQDFRNRQVVRRAFEAGNPSVEFFTGDGTTTAFTLRYEIAKGVIAFLTQSTIATATGTMTAQPTAGDTVSIQGDTGYWVTALDNTSSQGQVKIGATTVDSMQHLIDAINAEPSTAGISYNLPTAEQGATNAGGWVGSGPYTFTLSAKWPGAGYNTLALAATGTAFSWSAATLTGGTGTGSTDSGLNIVMDQAGSVPGNATDVLCDTGTTTVTFVTPPPSDRYIVFAYYRVGSDCVAVEDTALVTLRAGIEGGTGKYQQIIDDTSNVDGGSALLKAQSALAFYKTLPVTFRFLTDVAGLMPGQVLSISVAGAPTYAPALLDGDWVVQEVQGDTIPGVNFLRATGGHFRYTVSVINAVVIGTDIAFWQNLVGGGGGSSSSGGGGGATGAADGGSGITINGAPVTY